jgi:hypothetical protein
MSWKKKFLTNLRDSYLEECPECKDTNTSVSALPMNFMMLLDAVGVN